MLFIMFKLLGCQEHHIVNFTKLDEHLVEKSHDLNKDTLKRKIYLMGCLAFTLLENKL